MSGRKTGRVLAISVIFAGILLFSPSGFQNSRSNVDRDAQQLSATPGHNLSAEGTVPPPVTKPIKPSTLV